MSEHSKDIENTIEELVGFNFRSLRTIRDIILSPDRVFQAYVDGDRTTYTPALRIWLGLLSFSFLILFFSGGYAILLKEFIEAEPSLRSALIEQAGDHYDTAIEIFAETTITLQAPLLGILTGLSVFILKPFMRGLSLVARLNITFATLSSGTLTALIFTILNILELVPLNSWVTLAMWLVYLLTFSRGSSAFGAQTRLNAFLKAVGVSTIIITLVLLANVINSFISIAYAISSLPAT